MSMVLLCRLFKRHVGMTMRAYLTAKRIEVAADLLATTDQEIGRIAALLKFCDQSHFTLAFRKAKGVTPVAYRKKYRRKP